MPEWDAQGNLIKDEPQEWDRDGNPISVSTKPRSKAELPSAAGFLANVPKSAGRMLGGIAEAVTSPVQTAKGLGRLGAGVAQKIDPTGLLGTGYEPVAEAAGGALKARYGGVNELLATA